MAAQERVVVGAVEVETLALVEASGLPTCDCSRPSRQAIIELPLQCKAHMHCYSKDMQAPEHCREQEDRAAPSTEDSLRIWSAGFKRQLVWAT